MIKKLIPILFIFLLAACSAPAAEPQNPPTLAAPTQTNIPPTPTPGQPLIILSLPADFDPKTSAQYQETVYQLAQTQGWRFILLNQVPAQNFDPATKIVITLTPQPDLPAIAAANPGAVFLAVGLPEVVPSQNLSVLVESGTSLDKISFIAGVIAATITDDYHTGALIRKDDPDGQIVMNSFKAGQQYFCGLCNHVTDVFTFYPQIQDVPAETPSNELGAYADILVRARVWTMFIQPGLEDEELFSALKANGTMLIGTRKPAQNYPGWVVTLKPDYQKAISQTFEDLIAGVGAKTYTAEINLADVNETLFGLGKQQYIRKIIEGVLDGSIDTTLH